MPAAMPFHGAPVPAPSSWHAAFRFLTRTLDSRTAKGKKVIFLDELPWLASHKSRFLSAIDYLWNSWASKRNDILLIVCGSAASWMLRKIVHTKGGLHNRLTSRMRLLPFTLSESREYLLSRNIRFSDYDLLLLYMCIGSIPHYLRHVKKGKSVAENIDLLCFHKDGLLTSEFQELYHSLFDQADDYIRVIETLARIREGLSRRSLIERIGLSSGGSVTKVFEALEQGGFISSFVPYGASKRDIHYRLIDEYSLFYLSWIKKAPRAVLNGPPQGYWQQQAISRAFSACAGFSFEGVCFKHVDAIKSALGIAGILSVAFPWSYVAEDETEKGAQIDLIIDRADHAMNICEVKFSNEPFAISRSYAQQLTDKMHLVRTKLAPKKTHFLTFITLSGLKKNNYSQDLVDREVRADVMFQ